VVADEPIAPRVPKAPSRPRSAGSKGSPSAASAVPDLDAPADLQSQFEAAARLEAKSPVQAIQLYRGLENGSSSWAKNALFAHGRLEAARGNRAEARRILQQYLSNSPQGPNAADARLLLGRLE
jgi:TolA-binding protein